MIDDPCLLLIGPRGAGKSSVGRLAAGLSSRELISTDQSIETLAGTDIAHIVAEQGWDEFRRLESLVIAGLEDCRGAVIDLGGGAVLDGANRELLGRLGRYLLLLAPPEILAGRIHGAARRSRPSLTGVADAEAEVRQVLAGRLELYRSLAALEIDTSRVAVQSAAQSAIELMNWRTS
ncbi:MAG: shikimate kinase [Candidatus Alcyoniella australis]|nr:shikimate kinase [Candidatus Alcyoniella australis]